ncbi:MAG: hypothetical protein HC941_02080 [Microcoleus sp. SU_5_3]|nr:hypothetical protein [Microcoleus sp. SU_5_3]
MFWFSHRGRSGLLSTRTIVLKLKILSSKKHHEKNKNAKMATPVKFINLQSKCLNL